MQGKLSRGQYEQQSRKIKHRSWDDKDRVAQARDRDSVVKLNPRKMMSNPVMFVVEIGSVLTTVLCSRTSLAHNRDFGFNLQITLWLWFTVLFANFAEAMAEGRGKAQADTLRKAKTETIAHRLLPRLADTKMCRHRSCARAILWCVSAGETIPGDGEVIEGVASVDESAITGESAPVIREAGGDRSAVTGGTRVLSDQIKVRITSNPGETFLDRMIALVEGAERQKTPNEIALNILLAGLTIIFLLAVVTLQPFAIYSQCAADDLRAGVAAGLPDPDDDRRPAFRNRHCGHGPAGAAQRAGDVRAARWRRRATSTHCCSIRPEPSRWAIARRSEFFACAGRERMTELADAAQLSSLADETPEGRSIVVLAKEKYGLRGRDLAPHASASSSRSLRRRGCPA